MVKIGNVELSSNILLAPMAGVSDLGFRYLARKYGAGLTYTEMISVKALCFGNRRTFDLLALAENELPSAIQLFGSDPEAFYNACRLPELQKFDIIDINMGCPVRKVVSRGEGSALMKTPTLATEIVKACLEGSNKPVTVKHRSGYDHETAPEFASLMEKAGVSSITVHGRTREQMYTGAADWEVIKRVKQAVRVPVFGNGDIKTASDVKEMIQQTGCDGVMLARGAIGNPSIFAEITGKQVDIDIFSDIMTHINLLKSTTHEEAIVGLMKCHLMGYVKGKVGARDVRFSVGAAKTLDDIIEIAKRIAEC